MTLTITISRGPDVPKEIKAWVIPANGEKPFLRKLQTIKEPISKPTRPKGFKKKFKETLEKMDETSKRHLVLHMAEDVRDGCQEGVHEGAQKGMREGMYESVNMERVDAKLLTNGFLQPNIHRLPALDSKWNHSEGWKQRAVRDMDGNHLFYTRAKGGNLAPNKHTDGHVFGDMFFLKLSDAEGTHGRLHYVDAREDYAAVDWILQGLKIFEIVRERKLSYLLGGPLLW